MSFYSKPFSRLNRKTIPLDIPESSYKTAGALTFLFTPCMECCGHANFLCNPINMEESNVREDIESPWRSI